MEAFLNKRDPTDKEIKTGSQVLIMGLKSPFTPNELKTNDIT